jgi:hypothetical protein
MDVSALTTFEINALTWCGLLQIIQQPEQVEVGTLKRIVGTIDERLCYLVIKMRRVRTDFFHLGGYSRILSRFSTVRLRNKEAAAEPQRDFGSRPGRQALPQIERQSRRIEFFGEQKVERRWHARLHSRFRPFLVLFRVFLRLKKRLEPRTNTK